MFNRPIARWAMHEFIACTAGGTCAHFWFNCCRFIAAERAGDRRAQVQGGRGDGSDAHIQLPWAHISRLRTFIPLCQVRPGRGRSIQVQSEPQCIRLHTNLHQVDPGVASWLVNQSSLCTRADCIVRLACPLTQICYFTQAHVIWCLVKCWNMLWLAHKQNYGYIWLLTVTWTCLSSCHVTWYSWITQ